MLAQSTFANRQKKKSGGQSAFAQRQKPISGGQSAFANRQKPISGGQSAFAQRQKPISGGQSAFAPLFRIPPSIWLSSLKADIDNFSSAITASLDGGKKAIAKRNRDSNPL